MKRGWYEGAGFVAAVGALSLAYAVGHEIGAHPVAFVLYATLASGVVTIGLVGPGPDGLKLILHPLSWVIGAASVLVEVFYYLMLTQGLPAHGNVILRIAIPLAMLTAWGALGRRPNRVSVLGGAGILLAACLAWLATPRDARSFVTTTALGGALSVVSRGFAMEFHPWNRRAVDVVDKLRVTGMTVLATSLVGMVLTLLGIGAIDLAVMPAISLVPTTGQMLHLPTVLLGATAGGCILTLMAYLNLSSVLKIGTENVIVLMAFTPLSAWTFLALGSAAGWVGAGRFDARLLGAVLVLGASVLVILFAAKGAGAARKASVDRAPRQRPP